MSPEQAAGRSVDFHSDQFALGSILYEMAAGKRAFQRKTGAETLVAIMREEPEPLSQSSPRAPAPLRWIVERCLAKDPEDRYASTKDLARDLASVRDHLSETSSVESATAGVPVRARRAARWLPAAAAGLLGLAAGYFVREAAGTRSSAVPQFQRLTFQRGTILSARFAPDGQTVVYGAAWEGRPLELFTTRLDSTESRPMGLPSADVLSISTAGEMAISLDRHYLAGFESTGTLARVPLGGGAPRQILENVQDADWAPDGQSLAVAHHAGSLLRIEYPVGKPIYSTSGWVSNVRVSPDGNLVAFIDHPERGDNNGFVKVVDREGKVRVSGPYANTGIAWSPRGDAVWSSNPLTVTSLSGKSRQVWSAPGGVALHDITRDRRLLLSNVTSRREIVGAEAGAESERNLTWLDWSFPSAISQDGKSVLFDEQNRVPNSIYLRSLDGSPAVLLGGGRSYDLSPDSRWALTARRPPSTQLTLLPIGPGEPKDLSKSEVTVQWASYFPDGRRLALSGHEPGRGVRLFVQDLPDGKPRAISPEGVGAARTNFNPVSPDGMSIAAYGPDGRLALYPVEPAEPRLVPGVDREDIPVLWAPDSRFLYLWRSLGSRGRIEMMEIATGRRNVWKELRPPDPAGVLQVGPIVVAPDGRAYVYSYRRVLDELYAVTGLR
jgi:Tol biopolymer transport system component